MGPHFLCIGAQKAGTTWLHANLSQHPGVWMPSVKEVHFFDKARKQPSPLSRKYYGQWWRRQIRRRLRERLVGGVGVRDLGWDLNYYFGRRTDAWYTGLFEPGRDRCTGEVTPAYSKLSASEVEDVHALCPDARILFLIRDPLDRAWSGARMSRDRRGFDLGDEEQWRGYLTRQKAVRGDYLRTLDTWGACYAGERICVGSFDEISADPEALLTRIHRFLGLETGPEFIPPGLRERHNASTGVPMPAEVEAFLAGIYVDDLRELHRRLGAPVEPWLRRAERAIAPGSTTASRRS